MNKELAEEISLWILFGFLVFLLLTSVFIIVDFVKEPKYASLEREIRERYSSLDKDLELDTFLEGDMDEDMVLSFYSEDKTYFLSQIKDTIEIGGFLIGDNVLLDGDLNANFIKLNTRVFINANLKNLNLEDKKVTLKLEDKDIDKSTDTLELEYSITKVEPIESQEILDEIERLKREDREYKDLLKNRFSLISLLFILLLIGSTIYIELASGSNNNYWKSFQKVLILVSLLLLLATSYSTPQDSFIRKLTYEADEPFNGNVVKAFYTGDDDALRDILEKKLILTKDDVLSVKVEKDNNRIQVKEFTYVKDNFVVKASAYIEGVNKENLSYIYDLDSDAITQMTLNLKAVEKNKDILSSKLNLIYQIESIGTKTPASKNDQVVFNILSRLLILSLGLLLLATVMEIINRKHLN